MYYILYEFVALGTQHAKCMSHTVTCGLLGSTNFSTLSRKQHGVPKTLLKIKCVF
jgi:hypothetical protein